MYFIKKLIKVLDFIGQHWIELVIFQLVLLFIYFSIGYFGNGIYHCKFELGSCWQGVLVIVGQGFLGLGQYYCKSKYNSKDGEEPRL